MQVAEQFIRVCIILLGKWIIMSTSQSLYAAGHMAILGTVLAEDLAFILLFIYYKRCTKQMYANNTVSRLAKWPVLKEVTLLSLSVSMSGLVLLSYQLVDSFTILSMLVERGINFTEAKEMKGVYDRGQPLVQLGIIIASSLSLAIVPLIAHTSKKQRGVSAMSFIQLTYRTSLLFGAAAALGLVLVMPFVNQMLFKTDALTSVLMLYVIQIVPLSIVLTFTAILDGKLKVPTLLLVVGFLLKALGNGMMIDILGILGAAIASNIGLFVTAIGLALYVKKIVKVKFAMPMFYVKLLISSLAMIVAVFVWEQLATMAVNEVVSRMEAVFIGGSTVAIGAFVMLTFVAKSRMLLEKEWFLLPFGRRMAAYQLWLNRKK